MYSTQHRCGNTDISEDRFKAIIKASESAQALGGIARRCLADILVLGNEIDTEYYKDFVDAINLSKNIVTILDYLAKGEGRTTL